MLGTSPFIGAGQFGSKSLEYRKRFFDNPDNMTRLFVHSADLGVRAVQLVGYQPLVEALMKAEEIYGDFFVVVMAQDVESTLNALERTNKAVIAIKPIA